MNTRQLARALRQLAEMLDSAPSVDLKSLPALRLTSGVKPEVTSRGIAVNLATLAALSRVDRKQWASFVREFQLPIEIRARDASRDILGKLLKYLERDPSARERLRRQAPPSEQQGSPELLRALQSLLAESS